MEWQQTNSQISNYDNNAGEKGDTKIDKINTNQHFFFARYAADIFKRLHVEAAASLNYYGYKFRNMRRLTKPVLPTAVLMLW
jgi:iron complex outermembrane receptor protein